MADRKVVFKVIRVISDEIKCLIIKKAQESNFRPIATFNEILNEFQISE